MTSAVSAALQQLNQIILGKPEQLKLALSCLLADGHLLIEDLPGMGKTTLAHALAGVLGLNYNRIQFTSDLLPADILGVSIFEKEPGSDLGRFRFHEGPVFSQLLLADEINRATPKSQSALLEAMEERQVTVEGETRPLPEPFFVIATQNPVSQSGTFPLPESQLDRFLMCISLGYPSEQAERQLLEGASRRDMANQLQAQITPQQLQQLQRQVRDIHASASVLDYLQRIIAFSRYESGYLYGLSPRGALALLQAARAWALVHERQHVLPEDIQAVLPAVVDHRLADAAEGGAHSVSARILNSVAVLV
ncbi:AAA family ATPase [Candidatus Thalassolituus haligoni]|uniref:AAA family ATPase n=1 Tax=Candidatus Thalassolituus haligoni TaxID=3100113 RepID=UPI0035186A9D|tara:strand:- start:3535 stop:4458 length:924 start_codon:yes stop_codon:yes gene_type:complete